MKVVRINADALSAYACLVTFKEFFPTAAQVFLVFFVVVEREKGKKHVCSQYLIFLFCQVEQTRKYTFLSFPTVHSSLGTSITHLFSRLLHA